MVTTNEWTLPDGTPLMYQDGDHVEIETKNPTALPFTSGYIRGWTATIQDGGKASVAYRVFNVGNNPLEWVREEFLKKTPGRFGIGHGRGAHGGSEVCHLCGAGL